MKDFKFFKDNTNWGGAMRANDRYVGPVVSTYSQPMRWVNANAFNFHYRVYTNIEMLEVQRIITDTIMPFLYETNNYENQQMILRLLESRFHRAQIVEDEGL